MIWNSQCERRNYSIFVFLKKRRNCTLLRLTNNIKSVFCSKIQAIFNIQIFHSYSEITARFIRKKKVCYLVVILVKIVTGIISSFLPCMYSMYVFLEEQKLSETSDLEAMGIKTIQKYKHQNINIQHHYSLLNN